MTDTLWVGPFYEKSYKTGDRAFLVRKCHKTRGGVSHYELRDTPPRTDQSFEWRLNGWCGTHNDLATYGEGMIEVIKVASNGRLQVRRLEGIDLYHALEEFGFPELAPG